MSPAGTATNRSRRLRHSQSPRHVSAAKSSDADDCSDATHRLPEATSRAMARITPIETTCQRQSKPPRDMTFAEKHRDVSDGAAASTVLQGSHQWPDGRRPSAEAGAATGANSRASERGANANLTMHNILGARGMIHTRPNGRERGDARLEQVIGGSEFWSYLVGVARSA